MSVVKEDFRKRLIQNIKACGEALIADAENIVNSHNYIQDIRITCYVYDEYDVHYNVDVDYYPTKLVERITEEANSK